MRALRMIRKRTRRYWCYDQEGTASMRSLVAQCSEAGVDMLVPPSLGNPPTSLACTFAKNLSSETTGFDHTILHTSAFRVLLISEQL